jgi:serine/threonine protein kinase
MAHGVDLYGRPWSEREYILALDAYLSKKDEPRHENSPFIKELARLTGRTPASICMRMENFASIDPAEASHRRGLRKISVVCKRVYDHWKDKPGHLQSCADVLRREAEEKRSPTLGLFESDPVALPRAFGKYELLDPIGRGSFGAVYSCLNVETNALGAIKVLSVDGLHDDEARHRFLREMRALRYVEHPNVIRLHDDNLDSEDKLPAFVMELAESSLTEYANDGARGRPLFTTEEGTAIVRSMIAAVKALHEHKPRIIHRDLNPNNILRLPDGRWVLADFGLAKFLGTGRVTTTFATRTQAGLGTIYYAAPEQYQDFKRTDARVDVYALGMLLWELFNTVGPPPDRHTSGLTGKLLEVFLRATERNPDVRYPDVGEFAEAFEAAIRRQSQ